MLVVVVSACSGRALQRSRQILDLYLERVGDRTWRGSVTQEGCDRLRMELAAIASKNTAVAAHIVKTRQEFDLLWIIGSTRPFGEDGQYGLSIDWDVARHIPRSPAPRLRHHDNLAVIVELAGYWHDIGKANDEFQKKLKRGEAKADTVRHEILSACAFLRFCRAAAKAGPDEILSQLLGQCLSEPFSFRSADEIIDLTPADLPYALRLCSWMIATHHRLPAAVTDPDAEPVFRLTNHARAENFDKPRLIELNAAVLTDRLREAILQLTPVALSMSDEALPNWAIASAYGRLALILADRQVSKRTEIDLAWHQGVAPTSADLLANYTNEDDAGQRVPKQALDEHLLKVGAEGQLTASDLFDWQDMGLRIPEVSLPMQVRRPSKGRFSWQNEAAAAVKSTKGGERGFFGCLIAGTGAGKTRAIPKIMAARGNGLRYSLALALRSLTLQAGRNYGADMGFGEAETMTLIGDSVVRELFEESGDKSGSQNGAALLEPGAFMADEDEVSPGTDRRLARRRRLPHVVSRHLSKEDYGVAARFLAAPISISTLDQLMPAADARRTSYLVAALRLMSADLVIDEVDNFEEEDLVAIGRLVYMAGVFGRGVLLSSATLSPAIARGYYEAYRAGYLGYAQAMGKEAAIDAFVFTDADIDGRAMALKDPAVDAFSDAFASFCDRVIEKVTAGPVLRRAEIIKAPESAGGWSRSSIYEPFVQNLMELHQRGEVMKRTGQRFSVLSVRLSHTKYVIDFAKWFAEEGVCSLAKDIHLCIIPYHGAFPLLQKSVIEENLNELLMNRDGDFFGRPLVRKILRAAGGRDVMVVVVSTSIIETGRDYDFDGGVVEVSSMRALIQYVGRIERHRLRVILGANLRLLSAPLSYLLHERDQCFYSHPGPEETVPRIGMHGFLLPSPMAEDVLSGEDLASISARSRMSSDDLAPLPALERAKTESFLSDPFYLTLRSFHAAQARPYLAAEHANGMRFRRGTKQKVLYYAPTEEAVYSVENDEKETSILIKPRHALCGFIPFEIEPLALLMKRAENGNSRTSRVTKHDLQRLAKRYMRVSVPSYEPNISHLYGCETGVYQPVR